MTDGARMMLCEVRMDEGAVVPMHTHPHEQTGYLVSGHLKLEVGDEDRDLNPGDSWMIPGDVPHRATALQASILIDIFSPPREDYR
jgi:quercetin dioxygenase-like cupin family protein